MKTTLPSTAIAMLLPVLALAAVPAGPASTTGPQYTTDGRLQRPAGYREWIYLSTGLDMSYSEKAPVRDHSMFDNVFVDPAAWQAFKASGHWPDKAVLVLEVRGANSKGSINQHGQYQAGEPMALEVHVHDEARFEGGWGFFSFEGDAPAKRLPYTEACYACHQQHGAVDTTFTQFYPTALPIARRAGTVRGD